MNYPAFVFISVILFWLMIPIVFGLCIWTIVNPQTVHANFDEKTIDDIKTDLNIIDTNLKTINSELTDLTNTVTNQSNNISGINESIESINESMETLEVDLMNKVSKSGDTMTGPLNMNSQNITNVMNLDAIQNVTVNSRACPISKAYLIQPLDGVSGTSDEFQIINGPAGRINGNMTFAANAPEGFTFTFYGFGTFNLDTGASLTIRFKINSVSISTLVIDRDTFASTEGVIMQYTIQLPNTVFAPHRRIISSGSLVQFNLGGTGDARTVTRGGQTDGVWLTSGSNTITITGQFSNSVSSWTRLEQLRLETNMNY